MPLAETDYCAEQIDVPPKLPMILKQFCKSAIRTQPYDLLKWSSAYFRALADGEEPPAKLRLEYPPACCSPYGLTLGFLKVLLRQLGADYNKVLPLECILEKWDYLCLDRKDAELIIEIGKFRSKCQIKKFLSIAVGLMTRSLTESMIIVCQLFTFEPDGGSAMIPLSLFMEIYGYLAGLRCDGSEKSNSTTTADSECSCSDRTRPSETGLCENLRDRDEAAANAADSVSGASQDTEADIDLELDSVTKDDVPSAMTLRSFGEETEGSFRHEGEASFLSTEYTESSRSKSFENVDKKSMDGYLSKEKDKETAKDVESTGSGFKSANKSVTQESFSEDIQLTDKCDLHSHCPNVPGIGRRLLAEEVATVAIWMSDWARRQGGMVGPRNIRHVNCPPLEGCCCPRAVYR